MSTGSNKWKGLKNAQKYDTGLTKNWRPELPISEKYNADKDRYLQLLSEFQNMWNGRLYHIETEYHQIELIPTNMHLMYKTSYRAGLKARRFSARVMKRLLQEDVMKPDNKQSNSSIVSVFKKTGSLEFCVDCRKLHAMISESVPLSRIDEHIYSVPEDRIFSTFYTTLGYMMIDIDEIDRSKRAFTSHQRLHQILKFPFLLKNEAVEFQRSIDFKSLPVKWKSALLYHDKITFFWRIPTTTWRTYDKYWHYFEIYDAHSIWRSVCSLKRKLFTSVFL